MHGIQTRQLAGKSNRTKPYYMIRNIFLLGIIASTVLWACNGAQEETRDDTSEIDLAAVDTKGTKTIDTKGYILPSPFEMAALIMRSGATYDQSILNPTKSVTNYTNNFKKGLNLGIYGADLAYTLMYDKSQDGVNYLTVCTNLANELGIIGAFETATLARIQGNIDRRDSLVRIATDNFGKVDMYLKENERLSTSSLVLAGGWIEILYIATEIAESGEHAAILERVGEQKLSLELLIEHMTKFEQEEGFTDLLRDLVELKNTYSQVKILYDYKDSSTDTSANTLIINTTSTVEISEETFNSIKEQVISIRNKIIG